MKSWDDLSIPLSALSSSTDAVFAVDGRQTIRFWSEGAQRLLGYSAAEALGRPCYEVVAGTDGHSHPICRRDCRTITRLRRNRPVEDYGILARHKDGDRCRINIGTIGFRLGRPVGLVAVHLLRRPGREPLGAAASHTADAAASALACLDAAATAGEELPVRPLSRRETEILQLLAAGLTTKQVAARLVLEPTTVQNHVQNILTKLHAANRIQAIARAARLGLL